jgi:hypothetical protein
MPALTVTSAWQSRTLVSNELWQCWEGVLQVDTETVEASRKGIQLFGGGQPNCAVTFASGATVWYRTAHGPCVAGYVPQP